MLMMGFLRLPRAFTDPSAARVRRCTSASARFSRSDSQAVYRDGRECVDRRVLERIVECLYSMADLACRLLRRTAVSRPVFSQEVRQRDYSVAYKRHYYPRYRLRHNNILRAK